jgi:hypothetical protein
MPKYPPEIKERAQVLRSEGKSYSEIAKELAIAKRTVLRWSKRGDLKRGSDNDNENGKDNGNTVKLQGDDNNRRGDNNQRGDNNITFKGIKVAYDSTGSLTLKATNNINENPPVPEAGTSALKPSEDMVECSGDNVGKLPGTEQTIEQVYKKPDSSSYAEILIPLGLVVCGYAMKGRLGSKTEFKEERGDGW